jgi:hypothetical protein
MKRLWFAGLLIVFAVLSAQSQEPAQQPLEWIRFDSRVGQFTVLLPQMPEEKIEIVQSNAGPYTSHLFTAKAKSTMFVVGWVDYDQKFKFGSQSELNANRDNFIKGVKGKLLSSNNATFDGYQSLDFTAETSDTIYKSRVFIVGRRPYQLIVGTTKGVDDSAITARFFESFKIKQPN